MQYSRNPHKEAAYLLCGDSLWDAMGTQDGGCCAKSTNMNRNEICNFLLPKRGNCRKNIDLLLLTRYTISNVRCARRCAESFSNKGKEAEFHGV